MKLKVSARLIAGFMAFLILFSSCSSSTMITSNPEDAKLYMNGAYVGQTPYRYSDTKIAASNTDVRIVKEGYETYHTSLVRNERVDAGALIGGLFLIVPILWFMKYRPNHAYELTPIRKDTPVVPNVTNSNIPPVSTTQSESKNATSGSSIEKLRQLKEMLDKGLITKEEYESRKAKIIEGN